jgi:antitoxin (DNA-binding transcriptional repressor) of toxin-antitoxin stability system
VNAGAPILIDEEEARRSLAVLVEKAHDGQEFVITRDGIPHARLVAAHSRGRDV